MRNSGREIGIEVRSSRKQLVAIVDREAVRVVHMSWVSRERTDRVVGARHAIESAAGMIVLAQAAAVVVSQRRALRRGAWSGCPY